MSGYKLQLCFTKQHFVHFNRYAFSLLSHYLAETKVEKPASDKEDQSSQPPPKQKPSLQLCDGLTLSEVAHRTPGYEAGDLVRLILAIQMALLAEKEDVPNDPVAVETNGDGASPLSTTLVSHMHKALFLFKHSIY